jgi:hypothetical protein
MPVKSKNSEQDLNLCRKMIAEFLQVQQPSATGQQAAGIWWLLLPIRNAYRAQQLL